MHPIFAKCCDSPPWIKMSDCNQQMLLSEDFVEEPIKSQDASLGRAAHLKFLDLQKPTGVSIRICWTSRSSCDHCGKAQIPSLCAVPPGSFRRFRRAHAGTFKWISLQHIVDVIDNVSPGLINHGLLIRGYPPNSHNMVHKWYPPKLSSLGVY